MPLTSKQKTDIQQVISTCLRNKFKNYVPKDNYMPFHFALLGKDRMALYSFMQSLLTTFGSSIFEPVAAALAKTRFAKVEIQYSVGSYIYEDCQKSVQNIVNELTYNPKPDKNSELKKLQQNLSGKKNKLKATKVDLFVETKDGEQYLFDLKTAKPNKGGFQEFKQTILTWAGIAYTKNKNTKIHTAIAIPYNPYAPKPYQFWTVAGMLDLEEELYVAEKFWDFLGGKSAYNDLLSCFEKAGIELRPEIDDYFAKFNKK